MMNNLWLELALFCLRRLKYRSATNRLYLNTRYDLVARLRQCK